jgi:hypothetical protein
LVLINIGVIADDGSNFAKQDFERISTQQDNPEFSGGIIKLSLCNTK